MKYYINHLLLIITLSLCTSFAMTAPDEAYPENEFKCHVRLTGNLTDILLIQALNLQHASAVAPDLQVKINGNIHYVAEVYECTAIANGFFNPAANARFSRMPL